MVSPDEVHDIHRVPISELLDPAYRISVRHPSGWLGPGFLIGPDRDVILWGFTGGIIARLFDFLGWATPWDEAQVRDLPSYMLQGEPGSTDVSRNTRFPDPARSAVNLLDWLLVVLVARLRALGLLAGVRHRRVRDRRAAARRPVRRLDRADRAR